jgi:hypothetical protein
VFLNLDAGNENQWLLFDFIKGNFTGNILIPKSDVCFATLRHTRIRIWQRSALVTCRSSLIQVHITFYNQFITPSNGDIMHFVNHSKIPWYPKLLFQRENALASTKTLPGRRNFFQI